MDQIHMGPVKIHLNNAKEMIKYLPRGKQWFCGGIRSAAIAAELLKAGKIIALPTDTIYGIAGLAQNEESISKLYEIKQRDSNKPLAICLSEPDEIVNWAHTQDLPEGLINALLPGPTTLILKKKDSLKEYLNPGITNIGVRVPKHKFVTDVVKFLREPIALTSANVSNARSTLHPTEFEELWPKLDGIFFEKMENKSYSNSWRRGSTIVDLSVAGEFRIVRRGISCDKTIRTLKRFNLNHIKNVKKEEPEKEDNAELKEENSESNDEKAELKAQL
ncbi:hypothetical protein TKK_0011747 [Trichogramma kaykai]|uniref:Threonylcarbamoyl-AMP synthase n=1 Tax=Trichogramma kaykai TaxID=54128 RepID=A0ABD2WQA1_9HYME